MFRATFFNACSQPSVVVVGVFTVAVEGDVHRRPARATMMQP